MAVETTAKEKGQVEHSESSDSRPTGAHTQHLPHTVKKKTVPPPPLKHGERLTRDEFERRYEAMPHLKKAELIRGIVYMGSPVRADIHGKPHGYIMTWLGVYWASTPGVQCADNATVHLDPNNEAQPDALLRIDEGGTSRLSDKGYIEGAPELIVEIAGISTDYDLHEKLEAYLRNGVEEYIVWQTQEGRLDWFRLVNEEYVPMVPDAGGLIESQVFPGLRLAVNALMEGDLATVLSELQKGLKTAEHTAFVGRLLEKRNLDT
jgi:Uma2 family endonuclease